MRESILEGMETPVEQLEDQLDHRLVYQLLDEKRIVKVLRQGNRHAKHPQTDPQPELRRDQQPDGSDRGR